MAKPQIYILFCEDARDEVGNKTSLMGLLGPRLIFAEKATVLKSLTVGALCRFFDPKPVEAEFEIKFISASPNAAELPPQKPEPIHFQPPDGEQVWTNNILGNFHGLPVHNGMKVEACLRCLGEEFSATLEIEMPSD